MNKKAYILICMLLLCISLPILAESAINSSNIIVSYIPQYLNMSDTCKGEIGFNPNTNYSMTVCFQYQIITPGDPHFGQIYNISDSCKTYNSGEFVKNVQINSDDFISTWIPGIGTNQYRLAITHNRIQYKNMNESYLNNMNDTNKTFYSYPECDASDYTQRYNDVICLTEDTGNSVSGGIWSVVGCTGSYYAIKRGGQQLCRKPDEISESNYNSTLGVSTCVSIPILVAGNLISTSSPITSCYSGSLGVTKYAFRKECGNVSTAYCPTGLCSYPSGVVYSNFINITTLNTFYTINFSNKLYSNGTLYIGNNSIKSVINNVVIGNGFVNNNGSINVSCISNITTNINMSLYNNNILLYNNLSNNSLVNKLLLINWSNNLNSISLICTDVVNNFSDILTHDYYVYTGSLFLVDEKTKVLFNVSNLSIARVYVDDNSSVYDFKASGTNMINFTSGVYSKLRFELGLYGTNLITRYIDVSVLNNTVRVCANKDDVNHYEQLLTSGVSTRAVLMRSIYANCYIAADYTRFAYQDGWLLKAFSIGTPYYVYTYNDGIPSYLAGIDGSIASYINIDSLIFKSTAYNTNVISDGLSVYNDLDTLLLDIFYINLKNTATKTNIKITNMDNDFVLYNQDETSSPNNFYIYYNYAGLSYDNDTVLKIESTTYKSSTVINTQTIYIYLVSGSTNVKKIPVGLGIMITVGLFIFGFTFTSTSRTFGWLGIFILIINIIILAFTKSSIYVTVLIGVYFIILIFTFLIILTGKDVKQEVG